MATARTLATLAVFVAVAPTGGQTPAIGVHGTRELSSSSGARLLSGFGVDSGADPFASDGARGATISPNGDGFRDVARIRFTLASTAHVDLVVARSKPRPAVVFRQSASLGAGEHTLAWAPPSTTPVRTYLVHLSARDAAGSSARRRATAQAVVRVEGVDASFERVGCRAGSTAQLRIGTDASSLALQIFHIGAEPVTTHRNDRLEGTAVTNPVQISVQRSSHPRTFAVPIGAGWPSGVYYAQLTAGDGRVGYAPLVVTPPSLGEHRIAIVLPTYTWQAYNFYDDDGDGRGDTWYAGWRLHTTRLGRPYLNRGVPPHFRGYDLPFLHWLGRAGIDVDFLTDRDVEQAGSGDKLALAYTGIVFPGHHEYVTESEYAIVRRYRDLGGNLAWLSANNFFWKVVRHGSLLERVAEWRDLGAPEAALIGVQYRGNDEGSRKGAFTVADDGAAPWLFRNTSLARGRSFGEYGIEIDARAPASPPQTHLLASIPHLFGSRFTAEMTYYTTPSGAKVFAAGAFTLAGDAGRPVVGQLLANLFDELARP